MPDMDLYEYDRQHREPCGFILAGIDEAGRGPLAGPVVAAAVILAEGARIKGIRDSKEVPEKERRGLFFDVLAGAEYVGVGIGDVDDITTFNILGATKKAMAEAVSDLGVTPHKLLIDAVRLTELDLPQHSPVKGDAKSACIAAASIIAKYTRDRLMEAYHMQYPEYGFDRHKGYGTKAHMEALRKHGPCPIHRATFGGVKELLLPF